MNSGNRGGNTRGHGGFVCTACAQGNVRFCVHCLLCGSDSHRANMCDNNNNGGGNVNAGGGTGNNGANIGNNSNAGRAENG